MTLGSWKLWVSCFLTISLLYTDGQQQQQHHHHDTAKQPLQTKCEHNGVVRKDEKQHCCGDWNNDNSDVKVTVSTLSEFDGYNDECGTGMHCGSNNRNQNNKGDDDATNNNYNNNCDNNHAYHNNNIQQLEHEGINLHPPQRDGPSSSGESEMSASKTTITIDNQLMRDMYRVSTDKVYTLSDIHQLVNFVASQDDVNVADGVNMIANLKLIERLRFYVLDSFYDACSELDYNSTSNSRDASSSNKTTSGTANRTPKTAQNNQTVIKNTVGWEPLCMTKFEELPKSKHGCTQESCRFYLHCVLHRRHCTTNILELASNYLLGMTDDSRSLRLPFATNDKQRNHQIAKAVAMSQFEDPQEAVKFITSIIKDDGESVGLLHARTLAVVRSGLKEELFNSVVGDVSLALNLDSTNEQSIYRKAAVLTAIAYFIEALDTLEIGTALYPNNADFYEMKGASHFQLQELGQAEHSYRKALELGVRNRPAVMQRLGLALYRQGKLASAISVFKDLLRLKPNDVDSLISIAHSYRQQGEGKKALLYINRAVQYNPTGKLQLLFRGSLCHAIGDDFEALEDFKVCMKHNPGYELCKYHSALTYASLGQFYQAIKMLVLVNKNVDTSSPLLPPNSLYVKANYLINYYRYLHSRLDGPLLDFRLDEDLRPAFKDGWVKGAPLDMNEYFASEQQNLSPDIAPVQAKVFTRFNSSTRALLCQAQVYGRLMQVKADSFLPSQRFNLAMGLAAIHVGQHLRQLWVSGRKSGVKKMTWQELYEISMAYRRLSDMETPVLWLSKIYKEQRVGYHNEVSFYKSQVRNLRMKTYFELVFRLTQSMIKQQVAMEYPQHVNRQREIELAETPEHLISIAKAHIPAHISTTVPSTINSGSQLDGGMIILANPRYVGAALYMNIPTTHSKTSGYDKEMTALFTKIIAQASKLRSKSLRTDATVDLMMTLNYYFFNLCPLSRGSASVGLSTLVGMLLSVDEEMTMSLPAGKMLDMEATLAGAADEFIRGTKGWFKLTSMKTPITSLPLVSRTFPTMRSLMEVISSPKDVEC